MKGLGLRAALGQGPALEQKAQRRHHTRDTPAAREAVFSCSLGRLATPVSIPVSAWVIYCDGSAVPNPGRMGMGAILSAPDGACHTLSQLAPTKGCNNEAELRALMAALGQARAHGAGALMIYCDSRLLVDQLGATPGPPVVRLAALFEQVSAWLESFEHVQLQWIPRQRNAQADALARAALGMPPRRVGKPSKK